jgi:3-methylfumaryl-CoA hydratase
VATEPTTAAPPGASRLSVVINAPPLFRYSALTGNAHRIHYDSDYAQRQEGYPTLVVHGPLQATLLAGYATNLRAGQYLRSFAFRSRRPALLHCCPLTLEAWTDGDVLRLRSLDSEGGVCTTAEAQFAP